ncbi:Lrp/AsnC family transcriptional regulator [Chitinimonas sp.]|uniref:Lrp/AsnC family transcriptional regulator n=1 Tax=Chitinimonas sp. TaxID=1934313 RepID=UPI0035ADE533
MAIDKIDREILEILRVNARATFKELGERVCLSANAVAERVRHLQEAGVILGYHARVNLSLLELPLQACIDIKLSPGTSAASFEAGLHGIAGILEATLMTGSFDYVLRVACRNQEALVNLTERLRANGAVQETYTRMLLRSVCVNTRLE